jgi:HAD superfamily hydrolase (TIGR01549 family)
MLMHWQVRAESASCLYHAWYAMHCRRRVGIPQGDILDAIANMDEHDQAKANATLAAFEEEALVNMKLMPGTAEMARALDERSISRGLITRNVSTSVQHFHDHVFPHPPLNPALARTFTPYKPAPDALLHICKHWGIQPSNVVMVGDSPKDDIVCGNRAGAHTILIDFKREHRIEELPVEHKPTFHVFSMEEVANVLQSECELVAHSIEQMAADL